MYWSSNSANPKAVWCLTCHLITPNYYLLTLNNWVSPPQTSQCGRVIQIHRRLPLAEQDERLGNTCGRERGKVLGLEFGTSKRKQREWGPGEQTQTWVLCPAPTPTGPHHASFRALENKDGRLISETAVQAKKPACKPNRPRVQCLKYVGGRTENQLCKTVL